MINALSYKEMIEKINENYLSRGIRNDYIDILITRPDLDFLTSLGEEVNKTEKSCGFGRKYKK